MMIRALSWLVGFWLAGLFVVGQGGHGVPGWGVWLDGLAALFALLGGAIAPSVSERVRVAGPVALALGLFGLWIATLAAHSRAWLPWCNFLPAIFLLGGALATATFPSKRAIARDSTPLHPHA